MEKFREMSTKGKIFTILAILGGVVILLGLITSLVTGTTTLGEIFAIGKGQAIFAVIVLAGIGALLYFADRSNNPK